MQIAFLVAASIFPVNRIRSEQASTSIATSDQKTGRRQEYKHETYIHSRLVSHSARAPSVDDIPVHSICALAGALVGFSYCVSKWRLRANSPGSKFLALLPPERSGESEMVLLFHWGIDGFVTLHKKWKAELPKAALATLQGRLWVPSEVLLAFVKQMKTLLDRQLLAGQSLTAREGQVLQLLFRHLTNKEIAYQLNIGERTAKFHVWDSHGVPGQFGSARRQQLCLLPRGTTE